LQAKDRYAKLLFDSGLRKEHLVCPLFVSERKQKTVSAMPGMNVTPATRVVEQVSSIRQAGLSSIIIFGIPKDRNKNGSEAYDRNGVVQRAVREIKGSFGKSINLITDVCLCQYNLTGHCGLLVNGSVDNDKSIELLAKIAASHAEAGSDVVAPSAMMDGQVRAIRHALGKDAKILSYSAKHSSSLYAPFRSAAFAKQGVINKSSYQVSFSNPRQALREIESDIKEGADIVMVKPGLAYLDLIRAAKDNFSVPLAVQNVSGEYTMIKAAGKRGWIDEEQWKVLSIASMKRAGADLIISYFALDVAGYLAE